MNVMRFTGKDNSSALREVRQHLGPDALILSSRRTPKGIEICATASLPDFSESASPAAATALSNSGNDIQFAALKRELASLRETLQSALGERKWQDSAGQRPIVATISQRLATLGIGRVFAGELAEQVPANASLSEAWEHTLRGLTQRISSLSDAEIAGFRVKILVGASGAGKTRSAVAMLSEALRRHRPEEVAIISCGDPRLETQLSKMARALNLKMFSATDKKSLSAALAQCRWAREVIVDTPAINLAKGSQDPLLALLSSQRAGVGVFLVLPATDQAAHARQLADHISALPLAGAVITKVDEALSLGGVLEVVGGLDLPLVGRMNPQTEQILPVTGRELITNAKRLAKRAVERQAAHLKVAV